MKIALIIHRFGKEIVGGAEKYAYVMASILSKYASVDVLTTTAKDHITWKNEYLESIEFNGKFRILRFSVDFPRDYYWQNLHQIFLKADPRKLPINFCYEWIKYQGPYSSKLFDYLSSSSSNYDRYIFVTYLYPTTFFGVDLVKKEKVFILPTFHKEPYAFLPVIKKYKNYQHLFLTEEEKKLAEEIYGSLPSKFHILGFGIKDKFKKFSNLDKENYIIYAGRLEKAKGVETLINYFQKFYSKNKNLKLYLIGEGPLKNKVLNLEGIVYKGLVSEEEKNILIRKAKALVHPSSFESLSIVLIEAFMLGTPAIVNCNSDVLKSHIKKSKAGYCYHSYEEFEEAMNMLQKEEILTALSKKARKYFLENFSIQVFENNLRKVILNSRECP